MKVNIVYVRDTRGNERAASVTLFHNGRPYVASDTHPNFTAIIDAIEQRRAAEEIVDMFDISSGIARGFKNARRLLRSILGKHEEPHDVQATVVDLASEVASSIASAALPPEPTKGVQVVPTPDVPEPTLELPTTMHRELETGQFGPIYVHLLRRGLWLGSSNSKTVTAADNPVILSKDMGTALSVPSPTKVTLDDIDASTELIQDGYILFTDVPVNSTYGKNFELYDAADMSSSEFSSTADTTYKAIGNNVMRINAASNQTGTLTIANVLAEVKRLSVFVAARNNSSSTPWKIRVRSTGFSEVTGRYYWIDGSSTQPRIIYIGTLISSWPSFADLKIDVETAESSGTLDINYAVVFPHGQNSEIIGIFGDDYNSEAYARLLQIDHRSLTDESPLLYVETDTS